MSKDHSNNGPSFSKARGDNRKPLSGRDDDQMAE
jgi:hypothetical protein